MTNKQKRTRFMLLTLLFSYGIPAIVVIVRFKVVQAIMAAPTQQRLPVIAIVMLAILFLALFRRINKTVNELEFTLWRCVLSGTVRMLFLACIALGLFILSKTIDDLLFVMAWVFGCNMISSYTFNPLWQKYNHLVQRELRISEIREGVK